ncbi:unnamed protein product [Acanthoscelides obtectus]|uniref:Uncharacterized protein n=1 Tax=Acanthoscelides obtectus TaxID=200917 RepID=A0A9P0Q3N9_ACAOB|nr:unnamed protein product [Acanthoscelides obtectus]CAK1679490.1 hypothetical protein AOBTE_LOCUS32289 [Acanthoscelides obtectus]
MELCWGIFSRCYTTATVTEYGEPSFERGCTTENICKEGEDSELEYCATCRARFCNTKPIKLDKEVEYYLLEVQYNMTTTTDITTEFIETSSGSSNTEGFTDSIAALTTEDVTEVVMKT